MLHICYLHRVLQKSNFNQINRKFYCWSCFENIEKRYNPFHDMDSLADEDSDAFCENINNFTGDLKGASKVLDACQKLNAKSLVNLISEQFNMNIYFYNIDGNKSNFNTLTAELNCFKDTFSLIAIGLT